MKKIFLTLIAISTVMMAASGADLYQQCASCHGTLGEKKALGKSKVINELSKEELVTALKGYKEGSYGASMKALMKGQVTKLEDNDMTALAEYISQLKK